MNAIVVTDLSKRFGTVEALACVSLVVPSASIFGLLGPNGAGKSTLLKTLCGLQKADSGEIRVLDRDLVAAPCEVQQRIGYVSQEISIYEDLTVRENLEFFSAAYGRPHSELQATAAVHHLGGMLDSIGGTLSRGWQQRLALACAMLPDPQLLLLDEPSAGLDPLARRKVWELLEAAVRRGVTVVLSTHNLDEAERCDCIGYMDRGRILLTGQPRQIMAQGGHDRLEDALIFALRGHSQ